MKIITLGASGMIGSAMFKVLRESSDLTVWGTLRSAYDRCSYSEAENKQLVDGIDVLHSNSLTKLLLKVRPDVVVNCIGLTKHHPDAGDPVQSLEINAVFPLRLSSICEYAGVRLIHVSTDCVFQGSRGNYSESDSPDATDWYGKTKSMGEIMNASHAVTLRTSTIGHELNTRYGLLEWFLSQMHQCRGFSRAIFSGLPTIIFAQIVRDIVLPKPDLHGLYHVSASSINKLDLLRIIARVYDKKIEIIADDSLVIDRSLNSTRFSSATNYKAPSWEEMVTLMHNTQLRGIRNVR